MSTISAVHAAATRRCVLCGCPLEPDNPLVICPEGKLWAQANLLGGEFFLATTGIKGYGGYASTGVALSQWTDDDDYRVVDLAHAHRTVSVHLPVLEAWVGQRPPGTEGCHENDFPWDNMVSNLRWDVPSANTGRSS